MSNRPTTDTSANALKDRPKFPDDRKEPTLPVFIPMRIVRWLAYSAFICLLLIPAMWEQKIRITISIALVLGHFASQLNALINKK